MKRYRVELTRSAARDAKDLGAYIALHYSIEKCDYVLRSIEERILDLSTFAHRGTVPKELQGLGRDDIREVHFKPYRIIYQIVDDEVVRVFLIADRRRDLRQNLDRRLQGIQFGESGDKK